MAYYIEEKKCIPKPVRCFTRLQNKHNNSGRACQQNNQPSEENVHNL